MSLCCQDLPNKLQIDITTQSVLNTSQQCEQCNATLLIQQKYNMFLDAVSIGPHY